MEALVTQQELLVDRLDLITVSLTVGEFEARGDRSPLVLVCDAVVTAQLFDEAEETVEVDVTVADRRAFVEGCARVVHEFVELRDEVVFFFVGLICRVLRTEGKNCFRKVPTKFCFNDLHR